MKKTCYIFCLILSIGLSKAQIDSSANVTNKIDTIYLDRRVVCIFLVFFVTRFFSVDDGITWKRVGLVGNKLKPYLRDDKEALKSLNKYKVIRNLGFVQTWIIPPICYGILINYSDKHPTEESPGYLGMIGSLSIITGQITLHLLATPHLKRAIEIHNNRSLTNKISNMNFNLGYSVELQKPLIQFAYRF
jgi:hypothetical protein